MFKEIAFNFDGTSCDEYGLMIYFLDDTSVREQDFGTSIEIIEDRLSKRIDPITYGVDMNQSMSFPLTFGSRTTLTEDQVDEVLSWLTGHQDYKWLELYDYESYCDPVTKQPLDDPQPQYKQTRIRYRCHITDVTVQYISGLPFAFDATVECDGQWGYVYPPAVFEFEASSEEGVEVINNQSSYNGYLMPKMHLEFTGPVTQFSIVNATDNNREFKIDATDLENGLENMVVDIDHQNGIITVADSTVNLYPYFNKKFLRLVKGDNRLQFSTDDGTCAITMTCEWRRKVSD